MPLLSGKQILMIDDAADLRLTTRKVVETDGALFMEAESVKKGLELARSVVPHLILLDLSMPDEPGFNFLMQRKSIPELRTIPVIIISGQNDKNSVVRAISLGACDFLVKPFRAALLLQKIRKTLHAGQHRSHVFPKDQRPRMEVTVSAEILMANEVGVVVESPLKLGTEAEVRITSTILEKLGCTDSLTRTTRVDSSFAGPGRYLSEVNLIGLNPETIKAIRKSLKGAP